MLLQLGMLLSLILLQQDLMQRVGLLVLLNIGSARDLNVLAVSSLLHETVGG